MPNVERGTLQLAFQRLDSVNLRDEFRVRASVMKTVPGFFQGPHGQAMWTGPTMCARREDGSCGCCLPRMLLHRPAR